MSYGLSLAGYDVRALVPINVSICGLVPEMIRDPDHAGEDRKMVLGIRLPPGCFLRLPTVEKFNMPNNAVGIVHNKSTWARRGLVIPSVVLEPGWHGHATLAFFNQGPEVLTICTGDPIAQVVFHQLDTDEGPGYSGKYQGQGQEPVGPRFET